MESDTNSTVAQTMGLFQTFMTNMCGYFLLFIPLLVAYEVYSRMTSENRASKIYNYIWVFLCSVKKTLIFLELGNGLISKFLNLYTFGNVKPRETKPSQQHQQESDKPLLPVIDPNSQSSTKEGGDDESRKIATFILCFVGLQVSFVLWGLMQERIIKYGYSKGLDSDELSRFKNSQFLVLSNRLAGFLLACAILFAFNERRDLQVIRCGLATFRFDSIKKLTTFKHFAPLFICSYSSLSNVLSSWCQYESLKYVSFTSQLLAKSSKSVFVMITGTNMFSFSNFILKILSILFHKPFIEFSYKVIIFFLNKWNDK